VMQSSAWLLTFLSQKPRSSSVTLCASMWVNQVGGKWVILQKRGQGVGRCSPHCKHVPRCESVPRPSSAATRGWWRGERSAQLQCRFGRKAGACAHALQVHLAPKVLREVQWEPHCAGLGVTLSTNISGRDPHTAFVTDKHVPEPAHPCCCTKCLRGGGDE